ncbi:MULTISPECIES: protein-glutamate methylesterase/protein-glutamine glutaminase [Gammaproteobacteria]|uniref:Protein-glutamate methylesterase/protein-glutamine glutaminase n=1 Tax=Vreelandella halophila TaxID=86177 RepID=A0A9X4YC64_9GAMM|nr:MULTISPECIES: chemotaxis response regulator protein-glutamate methylesterase [Gammaproteobacteria]KAA8984253.1 chemotaxis response regulator protein-glutamate methylesterase [Halospina sp. K52047b]MYL27024.1 chemotaxis-specific protein-glutamate methyltransferase CheB [Halomonas utahensis]MYL75826.1 chemotaxis-specific protein-glutamate methyltransferase CheB [Halomonas sp. 22501_18_FS]
MTVSVLVVDDSGFFRKRLSEILSATGELQVVATATNGQEALSLVEKHRPDVITMDYEMPVMDGITAVRKIMESRPTPVLMFSSLTYEGARVTLDALEAGAVDFLPKNFEEIARSSSRLQEILRKRLLEVARSHPGRGGGTGAGAGSAPASGSSDTASPAAREQAPRRPATPERRQRSDSRQSATVASEPAESSSGSQRRTAARHYDVVAIGTSTGGPIALQKVLAELPASFPAPIILVQHMPASFTLAFADRLDKLCRIKVRQAQDGDPLEPGVALLAPGGQQMLVEKKGGTGRIRVIPDDGRLNYRPCVDVTFGSIARGYPGKTLALILTGMGADGKEGCRLMKQSGSVVWSQDEKTSVIYGMPMAVAKAGLTDEVLPLDRIAARLIEGVT